MDKFDLYIANPIQYVPGAKLPAFDLALFENRGLVQLGLTLGEAKDVLQKVKAWRANAYLVPVKYRQPIVSIQKARATAQLRHSEMIRAGKHLADLGDGFDDFLWWTFCADDIEAIEKELIPGRICISIDKLDGHIRTSEELDEWLRLNST